MKSQSFSLVVTATLSLPVSTSTDAAAIPTTPAGWRALAAADLKAARDALVANSPIPVVARDSAGPRNWLIRGYRLSMARLPKVHDAASAQALLAGYAGGFRDSHINIQPITALPVMPDLWPGFATRWQDGGYIVSYVAKTHNGQLPTLGARLLACDGESPEHMARRRLDIFEGNLNLYGRISSAPHLLWDRGNPFAAPRPRACTFALGAWKQTILLNYSRVSEADRKAVDQTIALAQSQLGVQKWGSDAYWIGLPRLWGEGWKEFFDRIESLLPQLRTARTVVVDARGNGGGDSSNSDRLGELLWGKNLVAARHPNLGSVTYRVSRINRDLYAHYASDAAANGNTERAASLKAIVAKFDKALREGAATFTDAGDEVAASASSDVPNPMHARVVVLTDPICTSACLDMADLFLAMPNTIQAGTETNADTIFMDITSVDLPSGLFTLSFGHKAWTERPRGSNVTYKPDPRWTYHGDLADDAAWKSWLAQRLRTVSAH